MTLADLALLPRAFQVGLAVVFGALFGSFLNVCILRWPAEQSVLRPPSRCPKCGHGLAWYENVPIVSWLALRGKCRGCGTPISVMYPLVELTVALLFGAFVWWFGPSWEALRGIVFTTILLGILLTDAREMIIPDEFSLGGTVLGFVLTALARDLGPVVVPAALAVGLAVAYLAWAWTLDPGPRTSRDRIRMALAIAVVVAVWVLVPAIRSITLASLVGFGALWAVGKVGTWWAKRDAMGGGDLKMMAMVGAFLGLQGVALTIMLGALFGTLVFGPIALFRKEKNLELPFGVFLAPGAVLAYLAGDAIVNWYLRVSGLA